MNIFFSLKNIFFFDMHDLAAFTFLLPFLFNYQGFGHRNKTGFELKIFLSWVELLPTRPNLYPYPLFYTYNLY